MLYIYYHLKLITIFTLERGASQKQPCPQISNPGSATIPDPPASFLTNRTLGKVNTLKLPTATQPNKLCFGGI